jgi:hypothetical protein
MLSTGRLSRSTSPTAMTTASPLLECVDRTASLPGPILEVGCFTGVTTVWLNKHLAATGIKKPYVAIDTFRGFLASDLRHEVKVRSKDGRPMRNAFRDNHRSWVAKGAGTQRGGQRNLDSGRRQPLRLLRLSGDLVRADRRRPGPSRPKRARGTVPRDDGALEAYREFTAAQGLPERITHGKLGVIDVPHR